MPNLALAVPEELSSARPGGELHMLRAPRITIDAFLETPETASALEAAFADRRMSRAQSSVHAGGIEGALTRYQEALTPNLVVLESGAESGVLCAQLEALAELCDPSTKIIVVGSVNDVSLFRQLLALGVSEYLVAPVDAVSFIACVARLYQHGTSEKLARTVAFVGAKGGVGSSTIAHNVAAILGKLYTCNVILADTDLPFGTARLGFNMNPAQGIEEALESADRIDDILLERLLMKHDVHLGILAAPASLQHAHDMPEDSFERLLEVAQSSVAFVVLDIPHVWTSWTKKMLVAADDIVITATPDLASLRNAKNLFEALRQTRANDAPPKLVLNQVGVSGRAEIKPDKFAAVLQAEALACVAFDPRTFSTAENQGRMLADVAPKSAACRMLLEVARSIAGRSLSVNKAKPRSALQRIWGRR